MERIARGIALEDITAVTKISQRHLLALEQEHFRLLPGGILSKGIVRGYASALGLDQNIWTDRFLKACISSGDLTEEESNWTAFASNVGKSRLLKREAAEMRMRWMGVAALVCMVALAGFFTVRFYGVRSGWWPSLMPSFTASRMAQSTTTWVHSAIVRLSTYLGN